LMGRKSALRRLKRLRQSVEGDYLSGGAHFRGQAEAMAILTRGR
jgi:hypothetical protein